METPYAHLRAYIGNCNSQGFRSMSFRNLDSHPYMDKEEKIEIITRANSIIDEALNNNSVVFDGIAPCKNILDYQILLEYLKEQKANFEEKRIISECMHGRFTFFQSIFFPNRTERNKTELVDLLVNSPLKPEEIPGGGGVNERFRLSFRKLEWESNLYLFNLI